ncbi:MAG: ABC-F family ATP-binding cassette domain-containing protein [Proteobacteria bacterium]|nr:ABC-F family ATP-binding cassette domain-containing protein [Pseudomonadota bacterium]MDA0960951.1 ABC-F family ATP-binding cassette domain-containing protein [Pseudomonadota bacterium]MDA1152286.1 ABC-F family ATP-binding cassette domain-containing protein [Pseudomonadota bacterium]
MLKLQNLSFSIEGKPLFENASAVIPTGHKVGIVGRNGTGKTSLFRLIRGEWALDSGGIDYPQQFSIGGVDQEAPASDISLLDTVLAADGERARLLAEADTATDPGRIADIYARLADIDAYSAEARAASILSGLGFNNEAQARPCHEFSGGWRMRVALASVLFSQPDLLLLDEPTNYLDLEGAVWLEEFLAKYRHTVLVISHDRQLLNRSVTGILHLTDRKLAYYTGSYDQFDTERRMKLEQQQSMARKQDAQRKHIQSFVDRFRYKASKARQAQSRLKQLEKMQPILALSEQAVAPFRFPTPEELPPPLLVLDDVAVGYDQKPVLRKLDLRLDADDRIALLGANGEGKSTLSKLFAGRLQPLSGQIKKSGKLRIGFFAQHQLDELVAGESPYQHMQRLRPKELPTKLRARLGGAGFDADIIDNPVERLSGGQKARLLMAMAAIDAPHILILDEPTNHLDIESREALVQALNVYEGTVIIVSHDSHLVEMIADQLWIVQDGMVQAFDGDMADYQRQLLARRGAGGTARAARDDAGNLDQKPAGKPAGKIQSPGRVRRQNTSQLRAAVKQCEKAMVTLAADKDMIAREMARPSFYDSDNAAAIASLSSQLAAIDDALAAAEQAWLDAEEALAAAEADH